MNNLNINQDYHCKEEDEAEMKILAAKKETLCTLDQFKRHHSPMTSSLYGPLVPAFEPPLGEYKFSQSEDSEDEELEEQEYLGPAINDIESFIQERYY